MGIYIGTVWLRVADKGEKDLPPLKNGDIIFQTTLNDQTLAIGLASDSIYIHTGIIKHTDQGYVVIHAAQRVIESTLSNWIKGGTLQRFSIYRYKGLSDAQAARVIEAAKKYYGKPYDFYFSFDNDSIYCSELDYLSFKDAGVPLGTVEKIGSLNVNNRFVKKIIEQRWQQYPACLGKGFDFDACYKTIMEGELITPASIARDPHMELIFTNYPW